MRGVPPRAPFGWRSAALPVGAPAGCPFTVGILPEKFLRGVLCSTVQRPLNSLLKKENANFQAALEFFNRLLSGD